MGKCKLVFILLMVQLAGKLYAQPDSLQQQINRQVWKPFITAFNNMDTEEFMKLHSKEMTRVIQDGNLIYGYETYYQENKNGVKKYGHDVASKTIELRFTQRIAAGGCAFETGYYKTSTVMKNGKTYTGYGKFHVLLRKENGIWKILMDADASENTNESIFQMGKPME